MKKKIITTLLAGTMALSLCACGNTASNTNANLDFSKGGNIKVWAPDATVDLTNQQIAKFLEANPSYSAYTFTVEAVGEGDAASSMITDVEGGADIFNFAQDQIARLVSAGALSQVAGDYATFVKTSNDAGAAGAATVGDTVYAFPLTSDNGCFLYYDKSVISDPSTLEGILADCEAAGKDFYMEINSAWYQTAFFFGAGCELTYTTDNDGNFTGVNCTYNSDNGVKALKAMAKLAESSAFQNGSSLGSATNPAAIVDGTWDSASAQELFGANYACAKLPTFTVDGSTYQMGGFGGFKLLGVKPQTDAAKAVVCLDLAKYLSGYDVQMDRFSTVGWGPSNLEARKSEAVQADEALSALAQQLAFTIPQGQYPGEYWNRGTALGDDIIAGNINSGMSDADLLAALQSFADDCASYAQ